MRSALVALALMVASPAMADSLPHFAKDTPYKAVRAKLMSMGYKPYKAPDADACESGGGACFPEQEACAGTGLGNCAFTWRKGKRRTIVGTIGDPPTYDGIDTWEHMRR